MTTSAPTAPSPGTTPLRPGRVVGALALFAVLAFPSAAVAALSGLAGGRGGAVAATACFLPAAVLACLLVRRRRGWWVVALALAAACVVLGVTTSRGAPLSPSTLGRVEQSVGAPAGWSHRSSTTGGATSCIDSCASASGTWTVTGTGPAVLAAAVAHLRAAGFVDGGVPRLGADDVVLHRDGVDVEVEVDRALAVHPAPAPTGTDDPGAVEARQVTLTYSGSTTS